MKIVFFGTPEFAVKSLDALVKNNVDVAAVVTMPDKIGGRGHRVIESDVKQYAVAAGLPVLQPANLKAPEFVEQLRAINADLFVVIAFRMLPEVVWTMPPLGTFNLHGSLLPKYRGAAPIQRAIMAGESKTGVTTFFLKHEIDTGDIIDREAIEIGENDTAGEVHDRLMEIGARLTLKTVLQIAEGGANTLPQSEVPGETPCQAPKIFTEDCRIDWTRLAEQVHNHIRGLSPHPGAWTQINEGSTIKILQSLRVDDAPQLAPGEVVAIANRVFVGTSTKAIELLKVQPAGKKAMLASDWYRGAHNPRFI